MKNEINAVLENMTATTPEPEDYTGEDGLLYCGKCRKPKEAYFAPDMMRTAPAGRTLRFITALSARLTCPNNRPTYPTQWPSVG